MSTKMRICYLCGEPGADSKDHLPPKALLPPPSSEFPRITVPAHARCNSGQSVDEEYVRDLIVPEAIQFGFKSAEAAYRKVWRAWSRDGGWHRYQRFLKDHVVVNLRTPAGLHAGKALGIKPAHDRLQMVGRKIVRGLIFHDSGAVLSEADVFVAPLSALEVPGLRKRDADQPYWRALSKGASIHTMCGDESSMRRIYIGHPTPDGVLLEAHFAIALWTLFYVASAAIPLASATKDTFRLAIDESSGEWVRTAGEKGALAEQAAPADGGGRHG